MQITFAFSFPFRFFSLAFNLYQNLPVDRQWKDTKVDILDAFECTLHCCAFYFIFAFVLNSTNRRFRLTKQFIIGFFFYCVLFVHHVIHASFCSSSNLNMCIFKSHVPLEKKKEQKFSEPATNLQKKSSQRIRWFLTHDSVIDSQVIVRCTKLKCFLDLKQQPGHSL